MKEKMLTRLERDRAVGQLQGLKSSAGGVRGIQGQCLCIMSVYLVQVIDVRRSHYLSLFLVFVYSIRVGVGDVIGIEFCYLDICNCYCEH